MQSDYIDVKLSSIQGYGIFAKKPIPKGTIWWKIDQEDYISVNQKQFEILMESKKSTNISEFIETLLTYSFYDEEIDSLIFCLDNGRYVNHSNIPNSKAYSAGNSYWSETIKDISEGEEITEDYKIHFPCMWVRQQFQNHSFKCW